MLSYIGAVNLSGVPIEEQRLVFMGAGSAGVGVAKQLVEYYTRKGLSEAEAREKFWLVDTKGLVARSHVCHFDELSIEVLALEADCCNVLNRVGLAILELGIVVDECFGMLRCLVRHDCRSFFLMALLTQ